MMHDMFMQKGIIFFEGLAKVNRKHRSGTWFYIENWKDIATGSPFKGKKTKPRKKFLKAKA